MKKYLSAGFIILLPFALTVWIISYLFNLVTAPMTGIMSALILWYEKEAGIDVTHHEIVVTTVSRLSAFIFTFLFVFFLGYIGRRFFFKPLISIINSLVQKIPFVRTIYRLAKDITKSVLTQDKKTFKQTVLIPFPSEPMHTVGFITADVPPALKQLAPNLDVVVFVPTAPHPISGYVLFAPKAAAHDIDISVEETFKFLISCGAAIPKEENDAD